MIATTIEQSKRLLELGLDPASADMCWVKDYTEQWVLIADTKSNIQHRLEGMYEYSGFKWQEHIALVPTWSLSALLEVMPKEHEPEIQKSPVTGQYFVYGFFDGEKPTYMTKDYDSPIDAAYEMVCWLLEQGLIKKGDNDE